MLNCFIGCLNKKTKRSQKDLFSADINDAIRFFFKHPSSVYMNHEGLYHIAIQKETELHFNSIPIYWQVLDNANVLLHQLSMKAGGTLIKLKTDCVVVDNGNELDCIPGISNYRVEEVPEFFASSS